MRIAVIAPGAMGAAIARRLQDNGADVAVTLEGRGAGSAARAEGLRVVAREAALVAESDAVLTVLPPGVALEAARRLAPHLRPGTLFADCNAVSPPTKRAIGAAVPGARFVDIGIIGGPPGPSGPGPRLYAAGPHAAALAPLRGWGIDLRPIEGDIGAAAALKMSYAGITKGLIALGSAMALGAVAAGADAALLAELDASQPELMRYFRRGVPDMFDKAYRWVAEMEEISAFLAPGAAAPIHAAMARFYEEIGQERSGAVPDGSIEALARFFAART